MCYTLSTTIVKFLNKVGVNMKNVTISEEAYNEFKGFLEENSII